MNKPSGESDLSHPVQLGVLGHRGQLINLAYRLLGSLTEAEDVVQEAYARWLALPRAHRENIESPGAWLSTVTGRICLDVLGSARVRREAYLGDWLPEPVPALDQSGDPADRITLDETITMAFLIVLESMTPAERVAFVLHDVFRYPFSEVAKIVGRTPAACRQLASSARHRVRHLSAEVDTAGAERAALVKAFKHAWADMNIEALIGILDPDVVTTADGGGRASALPHPVRGRAEVARSFVDLLLHEPDLALSEATVNGQPGLVVALAGHVEAVLAFETCNGVIRRIWAVRNPDKLRPWRDR